MLLLLLHQFAIGGFGAVVDSDFLLRVGRGLGRSLHNLLLLLLLISMIAILILIESVIG